MDLIIFKVLMLKKILSKNYSIFSLWKYFKNSTYPLSVSSERIIQAIEIIKYAKKIKASSIAHGSTGAGNDQVRFDLIFQILSSDIEIIPQLETIKFPRKKK